MRRFLHIVLLTFLVLPWGCRKEEGETVRPAVFSLSWEQALTKAAGDGSRIDMLLAGVYEKDAAGRLSFLPELSRVHASDALPVTGGKASFEVNLTGGKNYVLVFWAQSRQNQDYSLDFAAGTMTAAPQVLANSEQHDAFYAVYETGPVSVSGGDIPEIRLRRPLALFTVTVPQEDLEMAARAGLSLSRSAMRVKGAPSTLDLLTGAVSGQADVTFTAAAVPGGNLVAGNYVLAGDERLYQVSLEVYPSRNGVEQSPFQFEIPHVKGRRNYVSNLTGNVFTLSPEFRVSLAAAFSGSGYEGSIDTPDMPDTPPDTPDDPDEPEDPDDPELPSATAVVLTRPASGISASEAVLNAQFYGATGAIGEMGFFWGESANRLSQTAYVDPSPSSSGSFSAVISSLEPGKTYYFRAFVAEYDAAGGRYQDRLGSIVSFTTEEPADQTQPGYLGCYEMPAVYLDGTGNTGNKYGKWFTYGNGNSRQKIVTHTYMYQGRQYRNYTCLVDADRKSPLWSAHVMHKGAYPKNSIGRAGSWDYDPALPSSWQQPGISGLSGYGNYSKGHFVASSDRQANTDANYQTFFYTNQAPQWQNGFNGGVWNSLEQAIQDKAPSNSDTLYVVTGVLYEGTVAVAAGVPVPSHFYKCLMRCSFSGGTMTAAEGVAYLFENRSYSTSYPANATTIDAVEQRAGFDFFANVPQALQDAAERTSAQLW